MSNSDDDVASHNVENTNSPHNKVVNCDMDKNGKKHKKNKKHKKKHKHRKEAEDLETKFVDEDLSDEKLVPVL